MEKHNFDAIEKIEKEEGGLMTHEITPKDRLQNQIRLAADLFLVILGESKIEGETERDFHNRIMTNWTEQGYSKFYFDIEKSEEFKFHSRLQGDIYKITPADMLYYKEHGDLPEE